MVSREAHVRGHEEIRFHSDKKKGWCRLMNRLPHLRGAGVGKQVQHRALLSGDTVVVVSGIVSYARVEVEEGVWID